MQWQTKEYIYRRAKTLRDLLIHSKLPVLGEEITKETRIIGDYQPCKKKCVLCKNYLIKTDYAYSHQTETRFKIKSVIDCLTRNVIYLINDNICKISSVGYTADNMKTRFANQILYYYIIQNQNVTLYLCRIFLFTTTHSWIGL